MTHPTNMKETQNQVEETSKVDTPMPPPEVEVCSHELSLADSPAELSLADSPAELSLADSAAELHNDSPPVFKTIRFTNAPILVDQYGNEWDQTLDFLEEFDETEPEPEEPSLVHEDGAIGNVATQLGSPAYYCYETDKYYD